MIVFSVLVFLVAFVAAFLAIGSSVLRALPRIDEVIGSRGAPIKRTIRVGAPRSGWNIA
jgi:hypothetical protein